MKEQVLWCLENRRATRNCDRLLWMSVCKNFHRDDFMAMIVTCAKVMEMEIAKLGLNGHMDNLPTTESIRRTRQKVQNEDQLFPPTDPKVAKRRKLNIEAYRKELGYSYDDQ